jgi:hypothetical protein
MVRWPAGRCRIDAIEPEIAEFQRIDEHIDRANRIALTDPIIKAFRKQRPLLAIRPLNETCITPPADSARESQHRSGFRTAWVICVILTERQ